MHITFLILACFIILLTSEVLSQEHHPSSPCTEQTTIKDCFGNSNLDAHCIWCNITSKCLYRCHDRHKHKKCLGNLIDPYKKSCHEEYKEKMKILAILLPCIICFFCVFISFALFMCWYTRNLPYSGQGYTEFKT